MYFGLQLKKCFPRRLLQSFIYVAKESLIRQFGCDENDLVKDNFSSFTSDLFLQQAVDSNKLNRITFDCFVSKNSKQWQRIFLNILWVEAPHQILFKLKFGGGGATQSVFNV